MSDASGNSVLTWVKGDTQNVVLTFTYSSTGLPMNITGMTLFCSVKTNASDSDASALISKTVTSHTTPASGVTTVSFTNAETKTLIVKPGYWIDFKLVSPAAAMVKSVRMRLNVVQNITDKVS